MQISQSPTLVPLPFADAGTKNTIPESASPTPGLASLTTGFPPITFTPVAAGGIPPAGADFNGVLNLITQSIRWANAGGGYKYNSAFATDTNVNGYPQSAVILRGDGAGYWLNLADNNTTDPEGATPANWAPLESYGITAVTGLTNANVTLTPAQYGLPIITLAGTLTGNVQIIFPALKSQWKIVNATTGAFTVTCRTASGTGVIVNQGGEANVYGDGTNIVLNALQVSPATASNQAVTLGQMTGRLLGVQIFTANGTYTPGVYNGVTAKTAWVKMCGGGAAGGGAQATGATSAAAACGGNSGSYLEWIGPATTQAVTIGAGGAPGAVGFFIGGNGGQTSFGSLTIQGGGGGQPGGAGAPPYINVQQQANGGGILGPLPAGAMGGNVIVNQAGMTGGYGIVVSTASASGGVNGQIGGIGGSTPYGTQTYGAIPASFLYGSGGGGASRSANLAAASGFTGVQGVVVVLEFA